MSAIQHIDYGVPEDSGIDVFRKWDGNNARCKLAMYAYIQAHSIPNVPTTIQYEDGPITYKTMCDHPDFVEKTVRKRKKAA